MKTTFRKRNFVPWNRRRAVFERHFPLILKSVLAVGAAAATWKFILYDSDIHFAKHVENPILFLVMPLVGFVYVIFTSIAVESVFKEYKTISQAVIKNDLDTFLLHRDEQLPILMHLLVGVPSFILIVLSMFFYYENVWIGLTSVSAVVCVVSITWVVITELDNYENSIWFREKIPKDWLRIDIEKYFSQVSMDRQ